MTIDVKCVTFAHLVSRTSYPDLLLNALLGTMELQEQSRGHLVRQTAEPVACIDHHVI